MPIVQLHVDANHFISLLLGIISYQMLPLGLATGCYGWFNVLHTVFNTTHLPPVSRTVVLCTIKAVMPMRVIRQ